jgi:L-lactate utilization protein LutB
MTATTTGPKSASLTEHLGHFISDTLTRCTRCGACFQACPMISYAPGLSEVRPQHAVDGILDLLRQRPGNAEAVAWIEVCTQSGRCTAACPESINAMKMMRVARMSALGSLGAPRQIAPREERGFFRKIEAFARLQFSGDEVDKWQR